jgi:hypothetical protein
MLRAITLMSTKFEVHQQPKDNGIVIKFLRDKGAGVNARGLFGAKALQTAAVNGAWNMELTPT